MEEEFPLKQTLFVDDEFKNTSQYAERPPLNTQRKYRKIVTRVGNDPGQSHGLNTQSQPTTQIKNYLNMFQWNVPESKLARGKTKSSEKFPFSHSSSSFFYNHNQEV